MRGRTDVAVTRRLAAGPGGSGYVGDRNGVVRVLHDNSDWETTLAGAGAGATGFAGDGGLATSATLSSPQGLALDPAGNVAVADLSENRIRVVAQTDGTFYGQAMTAGDICTVAGTGTSGFSGDGGPATSASLSSPVAVDVTPSGGFAFVDSGNFRIRTVSGS